MSQFTVTVRPRTDHAASAAASGTADPSVALGCIITDGGPVALGCVITDGGPVALGCVIDGPGPVALGCVITDGGPVALGCAPEAPAAPLVRA